MASRSIARLLAGGWEPEPTEEEEQKWNEGKIDYSKKFNYSKEDIKESNKKMASILRESKKEYIKKNPNVILRKGLSVTGRISDIIQPRGGYIRPSDFNTIVLEDEIELIPEENLSGGIIGLVVDYMTRFMSGLNKESAFYISLQGAHIAGKDDVALNLLNNINGLDDISLINASKLVSFDIWKRNKNSAIISKDYTEIEPDRNTIENIKVMIERSMKFFNIYGPIERIGFIFNPPNGDIKMYEKMMNGEIDSFGGYTSVVSSGDGDFLTKDTLWDFKVAKSNPQSKDTLQILMYWIMGQHSKQDCFKEITKIGIFNPRLNRAYLYQVDCIPKETIEIIEKEIICYK